MADFFRSQIKGTGSFHPSKSVTNDDLSKTLDTNDTWIRTRTGIGARHVADPDSPAESNASLAFEAASRALAMAETSADELDMIIYGTCTPDTQIPSTASWLQGRLGAKKAVVFDLNAACSGFLYSAATADQFIKTGHAKTVLVLGSEVLSRVLDWKDRSSCILFGDGAGAVVLQRAPEGSESGYLSHKLESNGDLASLIYVAFEDVPEALDPTRGRPWGVPRMKLRGNEVYKVAVKTLADFSEQAIAKAQLKPADIDWFVPHQANLRIIEAVAERMGVSMDRVLVNIDRFGNTSSASVPTVLDEAVRAGKIKRGQNLLFATFGAGVTYGASVMRF